MKKLYVVTLSVEVVVAAESRQEAERAVDRRDIVDEFSSSAVPLTWLPHGWEPDCIAYGNNSSDESDRTVEEWIALGAAPEYVALNERLKTKEAR